jgi:NAD(P)-dependent dehydrogenase (short-subunit alcohol dehydrogenase family)
MIRSLLFLPPARSGREPVKDKTCIITGATAGIGLQTATRLGFLGARLLLVGRNRRKGEAALAQLRAKVPGLAVKMYYADLSQADDILRLAAALLNDAGRIDVLVNNAGAIFARREAMPDGLEHTFALNHMGYFRLTALLRPRLIASAPARIVNVASEAHRDAQLDFNDLQLSTRYSGWTAYRRSKLANILFTRELARQLWNTAVTVNCLHPGFVASDFGENNRGIWRLGIKVAKRFGGISVERGAETPVYLSSSSSVDEVNGKYFEDCRQRAPSEAAQDDAAAARLWEKSEKLAGFRMP